MIRNQEIYGRQWVEIYAEETLLWKDIANKKNLRENPGSDKPVVMDGKKERYVGLIRGMFTERMLFTWLPQASHFYTQKDFQIDHSCSGSKKRIIFLKN